MARRVNVIGVGMTKFQKPGQSDDYHEMAAQAGHAALKDAGIEYAEVEQAYAGYVYGDSTCGQRAVYDLGLTGIPVFNVNNNCSTGSTALMLGKQAIEGGIAECVFVVGFEKMEKGALGSKFNDRTNPLEHHVNVMNKAQGFTSAPPAAQMFGGAGREYQWRYGTKRETFAKISEKARAHASNNPLALFGQRLTVDEILASDDSCVQAFRLRRNLGVQFHPEVDADHVEGWMNTGGYGEAEAHGVDGQQLLADTRNNVPLAKPNTYRLVDWFLAEVAGIETALCEESRA